MLTTVTQLQLSFIKSSTDMSNLTHITKQWTNIIKELSDQPIIIRLLHIIADLDLSIEKLPNNY